MFIRAQTAFYIYAAVMPARCLMLMMMKRPWQLRGMVLAPFPSPPPFSSFSPLFILKKYYA